MGAKTYSFQTDQPVHILSSTLLFLLNATSIQHHTAPKSNYKPQPQESDLELYYDGSTLNIFEPILYADDCGRISSTKWHIIRNVYVAIPI